MGQAMMGGIWNNNSGTPHQIQPPAGGNWVPSVDETNATLYRNRGMQQHISAHSIYPNNPVYQEDDRTLAHERSLYNYSYFDDGMWQKTLGTLGTRAKKEKLFLGHLGVYYSIMYKYSYMYAWELIYII